MDISEFQRLEELFDAALDVPQGERHVYLQQVCGADTELLTLIERLLSRAGEDTAALRPQLDALAPAPATSPAGSLLDPGDRVGRYVIHEQIGEGGFAIVFLAEQEQPVRRRVALKIIKLGMDTKQVIARFEAERQALAMMDHPSVARVFDAGATETGRPFFVMEHVPGPSITAYCDRQRLSIEERLRLFMQVCDAVQHAHQKGIIHRDIKPSNVLVQLTGTCIPKVIDFGVAKAISHRLTEKTIYTEQGQLIGTPEYMSPEQAELTVENIDTRADIYSLGVLLYELLTGALPFDRTTLCQAPFGEIRRIIREQEPPKPSTRLSSMGNDSTECAEHRQADPRSLLRELRGDLDWITMKALEKDRTRRYATASELAADIGRYLRDEPVLASPPRTTYRLRKFVRRHRLGVTVGTSIAVALLVAVGGMSWGLTRALRAESQARSDAETAEQVVGFLVSLFHEAAPTRPQEVTAREMLDHGTEKIRDDDELEPLVRARLLRVMGNAHRSLALWREACSIQEEALAIYRAELGDDDRLVGDTLFDLAWTNFQLGDRAAARRQLRTVLEIYEKTRPNDLSPNEPHLARAMYLLANVLRDSGEYHAARSLYERVLSIQEDLWGRDDVNVAWTLDNFGELLEVMGEYEAARAMLERARRNMEAHYGPDDIMMTSVRSDLAKVLVELGDLEQARPLYEWNLERREQVFGADHPVTAWALKDLGKLLTLTGEYERARDRFERSLVVFEASGPTHVVYAINDYGPLLVRMGDLERAQQLYERAIPILEQEFEPAHPELSKALHGLAVVRREQRRYDEAESLLDRSLEIHEAALGPDHPHVATLLVDLAVLYRELGRYDQAGLLLERALAIQKAKLPAGHTKLIETRNELDRLPH